MNYNRTKKINNTPKHLNQYGIKKEIEKNWKLVEEKHGKTYENGTFFINREPIEKYYPRKYQDSRGRVVTVTPPITGIYFNNVTANFEAIKDGQVLGKIHWKVGQLRLVEWKNQFRGKCGQNTGRNLGETRTDRTNASRY